jgi:hypothetical protein
MPGLDDYGELLRSAGASVPDYATQELRRQLAGAQISQERRLAQAQQQELDEQQGFHNDLTTVLTNPTAQGYSALIAKHPKYAQEVKSSWDVMDKAKQRADLQSGSEIYSAAANGKYDLAAALLQRRIDADKEAGQAPDPHDQTLLDGLKSGDPVQQKAAMGMIGYGLAAITGPDKFEQTLGALTKGSEGYTLTPGAKRFDADNQLVAEAPAAPQYREIQTTDADGNPVTQLVRIGEEGGGPASAATGSAAGKVSPAMSTVASTLSSSGLPAPVVAGFMGNFHAEGGYEGAQGDGGSASGIAQWRGERAANFQRVIGKPVTEASHEEQAKFVAWEMQHPEDAGMTVKQRDAILAAKTPAQAAALIDKFYERSNGRDRNVRMSAASAFAGDQSAPSGGPQVVFSTTGAKKPGFRLLTPEEKRAKGLDPALQYQINDQNGQVTALGGQSKQSKQISQQVQTKVQPMVDVRDTINRLAGNWKDDFGGHYVLGDNLNSIQGQFGSVGPKGMRDWWADFQSMDNQVRNQLFGSALTEHEKRAYEATTISPKMDPAQIRKNLARRQSIVNAAATRQQNFLKKNGYDSEAVDALFAPLGAVGASERTIVRTGIQKSTGKRVVQYSDGSTEVLK